jgi:hypothetical protein
MECVAGVPEIADRTIGNSYREALSSTKTSTINLAWRSFNLPCVVVFFERAVGI